MVEASFSCLERVQIAYQRRSGSHARLLCVRAETSGELANATLNPSSIRGQCIASPFRSQDLFWILSGTSAYNVSLLMRGPQNLELLEPKSQQSHLLRQAKPPTWISAHSSDLVRERGNGDLDSNIKSDRWVACGYEFAPVDATLVCFPPKSCDEQPKEELRKLRCANLAMSCPHPTAFRSISR